MRIYPSAPIPQNSMLIAGPTLNIKMKQLSNPNVSGINTDYADTKIEYIKRTNNTPGINVSEIIDVAIPGNIPIHMWFDFNNNTLYLKSKCKNIYLNTKSNYLFRSIEELIDIDFDNIYGHEVSDLGNTFEKCYNLLSVDLSNFSFYKNQCNCYYTFNGCKSLVSIKMSDNLLNCSNVQRMFYNCSSLTSLDLSYFNVSKVTNMESMFYNCSSLTSLDLSHWDTSNVTTMASMFCNCSSLTSLDLSHWDTSNVTTMRYMFGKCSSSSLDLSYFNVTKVTDMVSMFNACTIELLNISNWNAINLVYASEMFKNTNIDQLIGFDSFNIPVLKEATDMFSLATINSPIIFKDSNNEVITSIKYMFQSANIPYIDMRNMKWKNISDISYCFYGTTSEEIYFFETPLLQPLNVNYFCALSKIKRIHNISGFKTNNLTKAFYKTIFESLDISNYELLGMISLSEFFSASKYLKSINMSDWKNSSNVTDMSSMFSGCSSLITLDLSDFDTSNVTYMSNMFYNCSSLTTLDLSNWNTSNVAGMSSMFNGCSSLTSLDLSGFDTSNVTGMISMFKLSSKLKEINYGNNFMIIDKILDKCISIDNFRNPAGYMFENCPANRPTHISWIKNGGWYGHTYLKKCVIEQGSIFNQHIRKDITEIIGVGENYSDSTIIYCDANGENRVYIRMQNSGTKSSIFPSYSVSIELNEDCSGMFKNLSNLTDIDLSHQYFNYNGARTKNWKEMFANDPQLTSIKYPANFGISEDVFLTMFTEDATNPTWHMFYNTPNAPKPTGGYWDMGTWNTEGTFTGGVGVTIDTVLFKAVLNANNSTMVAFKKSDTGPSNMVDVFDISKDRNMSIMLWYDTTSNTQYWYSDNPKVFMDTNSSSMFELPSSNVCTSIDLSGLDTSKVTNMSRMFYGCTNVTTLNVSHFDTSNVVNMDYMFINCSSLTTLDVSHFDTSKVTTMHYMFNGCSKLELLDVSGWNTSNVTAMQRMFNNCSALTILDVSHFDTSNVTNMAYMFNNCSSVPLLSISHFNTSNVTNMSRMINNCKSITSLDLSLWDTSNVTDMSYMFSACDKLKSLNIEGFNTSKVLNMAYMFNASPISSLNLSSFDTSAIVYTNGYSAMIGMFRLCQLLIEIEFSNKFILPDAVYQTTTSSANTNGLYNMYQSCYANKPTGGNWDLGTWDDSTGTFIKNA